MRNGLCVEIHRLDTTGLLTKAVGQGLHMVEGIGRKSRQVQSATRARVGSTVHGDVHDVVGGGPCDVCLGGGDILGLDINALSTGILEGVTIVVRHP